MRRPVLLALALALAVPACGRLPGKPDPASRYQRPDEIRSFATLYAANCAGCHGDGGRLGAARPLNDPLYLAVVPDDALVAVTADGIAGTLMPAFARRRGGALTDEQVRIVADGIRRNWSTPDAFDGVPLPRYHAAGGSVSRGRPVFAAACARCHGDDGAGGSGEFAGGSVVDPAFLELASDQSLRSLVIAGRLDLGHPDFRSVDPSGPLSERQINDVVAWIASQRREPDQ